MTDLRQSTEDLHAAKDAVVEATQRLLDLQKATLEVRKPALEAARAALLNLHRRSTFDRSAVHGHGWTVDELLQVAEWLLDQHDDEDEDEISDAKPRYESAADHAITDG